MARTKKTPPPAADISTSSSSSSPPINFQSRNPLKKTRKTMSMKAGLDMPVLKVLKDLKKGKYAQNIRAGNFNLILFKHEEFQRNLNKA